MIATKDSVRKLPVLLLRSESTASSFFAGKTSPSRQRSQRARGVSGITRRVSGNRAEGIKGRKAASKSWSFVGERSASIRKSIAPFFSEDARYEADENRTERRGDVHERDGSDACTRTTSSAAKRVAPTGPVSNERDVAVVAGTTPSTVASVTIAAAAATTTTATTSKLSDTQQTDVAETIATSTLHGPSKGLQTTSLPLVEEIAATKTNYRSSALGSIRMFQQGINRRRAKRGGVVGKKTVCSSETGGIDDAGRDEGGAGSNKTTVAAKIEKMLAAMPLSKLKIVIGKRG